jgi:hypothetical protein
MHHHVDPRPTPTHHRVALRPLLIRLLHRPLLHVVVW